MEVLRAAQRETNAATILITHDLGLIAELADRVVVMYAGRVVELGGVYEIFANPKHPYTVGLMNSLARLDADLEWLKPIPGRRRACSRRLPAAHSTPGAPTRRGRAGAGPTFRSSARSARAASTLGVPLRRGARVGKSSVRSWRSRPDRDRDPDSGGDGRGSRSDDQRGRRAPPDRGARQALPDQAGPVQAHRRAGAGRLRRRPDGPGRRDAGDRRRVRVRQDDARPDDHQADRADRGDDHLRRAGHHRPQAPRDATRSPRHPDRLPGSRTRR